MAYLFDKTGKRITIAEEELQLAQDDGSYVIILDYGTNTDGKSYWFYVAVKRHLYTKLRGLIAQRAVVCFKEYGRILRYGYDREVPAAIKQEMKEKHGVDEVYMQWLIEDARKARQAYLKEQAVQENKRIGDIVAMLKAKQQ